MDLIKCKKYKIFDYHIKKNGKINFHLFKYYREINIKGVIIKYYNFDYSKNFELIKQNNDSLFTEEYNLNLLLLYSYFRKNNDLYYIKYGDGKNNFVFLYSNKKYIINYLYINQQIYDRKKLFKIYSTENYIINIILEYINQILFHNKKYSNEIFIKIFYQYYIRIIESEIYLLYNKKYSDFASYSDLYIFLKKKGYVDNYYKKLVPIIKKNYKKVLEDIDFSGIKDFEKKILKKMKPYSKININKIINECYTNKKQNKIIKNKLKELTKKLNI